MGGGASLPRRCPVSLGRNPGASTGRSARGPGIKTRSDPQELRREEDPFESLDDRVAAGDDLAVAAILALGCSRREKESGPAPATATAPSPSPPAAPAATCPIQFRDVTSETGITFVHTDGSSGAHFIVEAMSTGLATIDYDGDGLLDVYFPSGAPLPGMNADIPPRHSLYRNLGNWKFHEVTDAADVVCHAYGMGVVVGDYDNDGFPDFYLSDFGPNVLYHNNGDGTFSDVTEVAGVARRARSSARGLVSWISKRTVISTSGWVTISNSISTATSRASGAAFPSTHHRSITHRCPTHSTATMATAHSRISVWSQARRRKPAGVWG